ncbi:unnamed protein product [Lymnaea stagnalis]|uniref:Protein kinase domain-containing protein n=1 Tax=Lymnaea stagnalis TaxID=6523 RepID=A0AAV2I6F5_LYMST
MAQFAMDRTETESNSKECITVIFVNKDIDPLTLCTSSTEHQNSALTCQFVIQQCIHHCQQIVCAKGSDHDGLKFLPVFGLVVLPEEKLWLPGNYKFERSSDKKRCYKFKVRFRPPVDFQCKDDSNNFMWDYMFLQIYEDFLLGDLGGSEKLNEKNIFQLISWALLMPKNLPFNSALVVDEEYKERQVRFWNFRSTFSKSIRTRLISTCCIDHYWIIYTLKESLKNLKGAKHTLGYYKQKFYQLLVEAEPSYCSEHYEVPLGGVENSDKVTVTVNYFGENHQPAICYGEELQCVLTEIVVLKLARPKNFNAKVWEVTIELKNDENQRKLQFTEEVAAKSFLSMVQGFFSLYVRHDVCLNKDIQTFEAQTSSELWSFGPLRDETAVKYLKEPLSPGESKHKRYLVHESLVDYGCYVVVAGTNRSVEVFSVQRFLLTISRDRSFNLSRENHEDVQTFRSSKDLRSYLKNEFGMQEHPRYYQTVSEIESVFKISNAQPYHHEDRDDSSLPGEPVIYLREDLEKRKVIRDKNPQVLKFEVSLKGKKMMLVELQSDDGKIAEGFREGIQDLIKLHKKKPDNFLKFYGMVWERKMCVLMEYTKHFDLLTYICENPQTVRQKMKIIHQILKILSVMEEHNLYHGNIRLRRFMVFMEDGSTTPQVKLGYSGITSYLNSKSKDDLDNLERLPWLSPERRHNLKKVTYESECYSVGTALCELIYRSDQFHMDLKLGNLEMLVKYFEVNTFLPKPDNIKAPRSHRHDSSDSLECKSKAVLEEVWDNIIMRCWAPEMMERPSTRELCKIFSEINIKAEEIDKETATEELKQMVYDVGLKEEIPKTGNAPPTKQDLEDILMKNSGDKFLADSCVELMKNKPLGRGFFGVVWEGRIRPPNRNLNHKGRTDEWRKVAIKRFVVKEQKDARARRAEMTLRESNLTKEVVIACSLNHPNIVKATTYLTIHFFNTSDKNYSNVMLIMEFMNAGDLSHYYQKHKKSSDLITKGNLLKICLDVAEGMVYLSGKEIVHRDLAARNILLALQGNGQIIGKVSDFGLARNMEENYKFYRNKANALPVAWMPPECLDSHSEDSRFTSKGDVWSFGTVIWEAFARGKLPKDCLPRDVKMDHDDCQEVLFNHYKRGWRLEVGPDIDTDIHQVMKDCWELDPAKRPFFVELVLRLKDAIERDSLCRGIIQRLH